jgi:hypothetical protein
MSVPSSSPLARVVAPLASVAEADKLVGTSVLGARWLAVPDPRKHRGVLTGGKFSTATLGVSNGPTVSGPLAGEEMMRDRF